MKLEPTFISVELKMNKVTFFFFFLNAIPNTLFFLSFLFIDPFVFFFFPLQNSGSDYCLCRVLWSIYI